MGELERDGIGEESAVAVLEPEENEEPTDVEEPDEEGDDEADEA